MGYDGCVNCLQSLTYEHLNEGEYIFLKGNFLII